MSNPAQSLGADLMPNLDSKKRKMTQAIIEEQEKGKEAYEFLEDDDDFEEFEIQQDYCDGDVEMDGGRAVNDWDDESLHEDF